MTVVQRSPTAGIQGGVSLRWVPVYTGTTAGDGAPHTVGGGAPHTVGRQRTHIVISRDGGRRRTHIVIPATAGIDGEGRQGWVPVYTGTTVGRRRTPHRSFPRRQRAHIVIPATAGGGRQRWVPVYTGTTAGGGAPTSSFPATGGRRRTHIVILATGGGR